MSSLPRDAEERHESSVTLLLCRWLPSRRHRHGYTSRPRHVAAPGGADGPEHGDPAASAPDAAGGADHATYAYQAGWVTRAIGNHRLIWVIADPKILLPWVVWITVQYLSIL